MQTISHQRIYCKFLSTAWFLEAHVCESYALSSLGSVIWGRGQWSREIYLTSAYKKVTIIMLTCQVAEKIRQYDVEKAFSAVTHSINMSSCYYPPISQPQQQKNSIAMRAGP